MSTECERLAAVLCAIASDRDHARQDPIWAAEADDLRAAAALLRASSAEQGEPGRVTELEELAWGLIANANEGNWDAAHPEWKDAAVRWREAYHAKLRAPQADASGQAELRAVQEERDRLEAVIERDRAEVASAVHGVRSVLHGFGWLTTGRGSYEWDDERWKEEFGRAVDGALQKLEPLNVIARDWSNCPRTQEAVIAARGRRRSSASPPPSLSDTGEQT